MGQGEGAVVSDDAALAYERAVNQGYRQRLELMVERSPELANAVTASRSSQWTGGAPHTQLSRNVIAPIVGRVALDDDDPDLGSGTFYIGSWHDDAQPPTVVVSWAAPVAQLFYKGPTADDPRRSLVRGRRTFVNRHLDIDAFTDDLEPGVPSDPFATATTGALSIPKAPGVARPAARPRPSSDRPVEERARRSFHRAPAPQAHEPRTKPPESSSTEPTTPLRADDGAGVDPVHNLRAGDAVIAAVSAPRGAGLGSVLATLQPGQYDLVTHPHDQPLIIQGAPGTGKTIIATHRAAFLTNADPGAERPPGLPLASVGLIGPTAAWRHHVASSVDQLSRPGAVHLVDLPTYLGTLAGLTLANLSGDDGPRVAWSWNVGRVADRAVALLRSARKGKVLQVAEVVKAMVTGHADVLPALTIDDEVTAWLRSSGGWDHVRRSRAHLGLVAAVGQALGRGDGGRLDHLIVDEAQDIRPLEWKLIDARRRPGSTMTLVGDLNQRRCDWSASSWQQIADDLELADGKVPVERLKVAYRSTKSILRFANPLLPATERVHVALRDGRAPEVARTAAADITRRAATAAADQAGRHPDGRVAVIGMHPTPVSDHLRRSGWRVDPVDRDRLVKDGQSITAVPPEKARGLEFDAVIVIEPADFPQNLGRHGALFTSLTRATQHLVVVHSKPMPGGLRAPR